MKLSTLMVINSVICAVFGIAFVLIPWQVFSLYGSGEPNPALNYADSDARKAIVLALLIGDGIGFIVALIAQLGDIVNIIGWSTVAIYLILALGFGYFQFTKSSS